jgi:hypothetical protein
MGLESVSRMGRLAVSNTAWGSKHPIDETGRDPRPSGAPFRMRLVQSGPEGLVFEGRHRLEPSLLLAPLFGLLGALPWLAPEPPDLGRCLVSALCLGTAGVLCRVGWPSRTRLAVDPRREVLRRGTERLPLTTPPRFRLGMAAREFAPTPHYHVALLLDAGAQQTLIGDTEPHVVLRQLREMLRSWPGSVEPGWGLPAEALTWLSESAPPAPPRDTGTGAVSEIQVFEAPRSLCWAMAIMAAFVVIDLFVLVSSASAALPRTHPLSSILATLLGGALLLLGLFVVTSRSRFHVAGSLEATAGALGLRKRQAPVPLAFVRGVYALQSTSAEQRHVFVDTALGPLSLPVPQEKAESVCRQLRDAIARAKLPG